jgi:hypothetical protein
MAGQLLTTQEPIQKTSIGDHINERMKMIDTPAQHSCQCAGAKDLAALATKLVQVMKACANVPKDKQNPDQNYKYVSSDAVLLKANHAFVDAGLATVCRVDVLDRQPRTTRTGAIWELVTARCSMQIIDSETGASIESEGIGQGYDSSDKAFSKAQTQASKYCLLLALNISTGEDPEASAEVDTTPAAPVTCKKCGGPAKVTGEGEDKILGPFEEHTCAKCGTFRVKA